MWSRPPRFQQAQPAHRSVWINSDGASEVYNWTPRSGGGFQFNVIQASPDGTFAPSAQQTPPIANPGAFDLVPVPNIPGTFRVVINDLGTNQTLSWPFTPNVAPSSVSSVPDSTQPIDLVSGLLHNGMPVEVE